MKKYSVLIPCHQDNEFLSTAIESVKIDIPSDVDIHLVVDRNHDLFNKLKAIYQETPQIILHLSNNSKNLGAVLNFAINRIDTEFIFRMDSDDIWKSGRFHARSLILKPTQI